jgi:hypothetical protein
MHARRLFLLSIILVVGLCPLLAASPDTTVNMTFSGTLGPILSGSDPLGGNGQIGSIMVAASESLKPTKKTTTSATYTLPVGAITVVIGGTTYGSPKTSTMKISIPASGPDTIVITTSVTEFGISGTVVGTASLAKGSFSKTVLSHPTTFKPSPQTLTSATTAGGPGSQVKYTVFGGTTVLGFAGTASNTAAQGTN